MKTALACGVILLVAIGLVRADDLTTRDGKVYKGYKVLSHDAGFITIIYADGGGKIPLSNLPDALQKQYGYDPAKEAAAEKAAEADWKASQAALQAERERAKQPSTPVAQQQQTPSAALPVTKTAHVSSDNDTVDIDANNQQIAKDQADIASLSDDLAHAIKDYRYDPKKTDSTGNRIIDGLNKQIKDKREEISRLQDQNTRKIAKANRMAQQQR